MQEKHKSIANALELHFSYIDDPSNSLLNTPGGRLNKKHGLTRYGNSHVKDKTS